MKNPIYSIPSYLPLGFRDYVKEAIKSDECLGVINPIERLISYVAMKEVWQKLALLHSLKSAINNSPDSETGESATLIHFLNLVTGHTSLFGKPDDYIDIPSDKVQREAYLSIQKNLESIVATLQSLTTFKKANINDPSSITVKQGSVQQGWNFLEEAVHRSNTDTLQSPSFKETKQLGELIFELNIFGHASDNQLDVQSMLETMTFAAIAASHAKNSNLPKRRHTPEAKINSFILYLSDYFMTNFNKPFDDLVAITTNTAFGLDDEISENKVYKLRQHLNKNSN